MPEPLLTFFKALADANRLRIIGLLAHRPHHVEELAVALGLRQSTTSHHLARLAEAGLVSTRVDGHFHVYALDTEALEATAKQLLARDSLPALAGDTGLLDEADRKVVETFTGPDGRISKFPMQRKKFEAILRHVAAQLEPGVDYDERTLNTHLRRYSDDTATLRRGLIDHQLMAREPGGARYWRV
jgi:DNA-binding transcriptional ArsR family regulator